MDVPLYDQPFTILIQLGSISKNIWRIYICMDLLYCIPMAIPISWFIKE